MTDRHSRAERERERYLDHIARGLCVRCDDKPVTGTRLCPRHTEMRAEVDKGARRRMRGATGDQDHVRSDPDYQPTHWCRVCYGMAHRRPQEGCWSCGEPYIERRPELRAAYGRGSWGVVTSMGLRGRDGR